MKILAVRGENICSLQARFEIDFTAEPLAGAGLFAISGPTGAGKSTLLDCICLPLYHVTPRLLSAPQREVSVPDAAGEISVSDPRNLLRKGAQSGFAEVDFCGTDKQRYRARWEVSRARGRENKRGNLKKVEASLFSLSEDKLLSNSVQEIKPMVVAKVGLTFAEFTRSVMLAQNEFTSFLKASENEKAAILEKLTGVDIFSKIGSSIYKKNESYAQQLKVLQTVSEQTVVLSEEQRSDLQQQVQRFQTELEIHKNAVELLKAELRARHSIQQLNDKVAASENEQSSLNVQMLKEEERCHQVEKNLAELVSIRSSNASDIARARELDVRLATQSEELRRVHEQWQKKLTDLAAVRGEISKSENDKKHRQEQSAKCGKWKNENSRWQSWSDHWPVLRATLTRAESLQGDIAKQEQELSNTHREALEQNEKKSAVDKELTKLKAELDQLVLQIEKYSAELSGLSLLDLEKLKSSAEADVLRFQKLVKLKKADAEERNELLKFANRIQESETLSNNIEVQITQIRETQSGLEQERVVQEKLVGALKIKVSANVEALRSGLVEGEECPVCGSRSHPLVNQEMHHPLQEMLRDALAELDGLIERTKATQNELMTRTSELAEARSVSKQATARFETLQNSINKISLEWSQCAPEFILSETAPDFLEEKLRESESSAEQHRLNFMRATQTNELLQKIQNKKNLSIQKFDQKNAELQEILLSTTRLEERAHKLEAANKESVGRFESELASVDDLTGPSAWRGEWLKNPRGFMGAIEVRVVQWQKNLQQEESLRSELSGLEVRLISLNETLHSRVAEEQQVREFHEQQSDALKSFQNQRASLFGGKSVAEVEADWESQVAQENSNLKLVKEHLQQLQIEISAVQERIRQTQGEIEKMGQESVTRRARISTLREGFTVTADPDDLQSALDNHEVALAKLDANQVELRGALEADRRAQQEVQGRLDKMKEISELHSRWKRLNDLIGCATGSRFRKEAQHYTLEILLAHANRHLESFAPRYQLLTQAETLNILVEDIDSGGELRSVYSLSGGESFLISLALAMGLSSLSSEQVQVESLFIDEGFGSLDAESLRIALNALDALQSQGRKVGVISHVGDMAERIGVQIQVLPIGQGRSRVLPPQF
ncbi:MAG: nuclease SbcCD subunit [Pseudomonadota bacterium]|jgi:exonuclease SbcC